MTHTHDVLIVGGGNAGISLAARLRKDGFEDVVVIEPRATHHYRPLLSYVGGGQATLANLQKPQSDVIPDGVTWIQDDVASVDPSQRTVTTTQGMQLSATDLVLCPGIEPDWHAVPGSQEAVMSLAGSSNYVDERAPHTWELIRGLRSGAAVFVVAGGPVPCAGAGLKPLFMAADHWRREGVLDAIDVTVVLEWPTIFGIPQVDDQLNQLADDFGIHVVTGARLTGVDAAQQTLAFELRGEPVERAYDLLHYVPLHKPRAWIAESNLSDEHAAGMIAIDSETLAHREFDAVWGLGDAADVRASRSGGGLRKQAGVVADNIAARRAHSTYSTYNGYSTAPITVGRDRLVLAEFDRHLKLTPTVPFPDLVKPRRLTWAYDRYLQPQTYWRSILKGRVSS